MPQKESKHCKELFRKPVQGEVPPWVVKNVKFRELSKHVWTPTPESYLKLYEKAEKRLNASLDEQERKVAKKLEKMEKKEKKEERKLNSKKGKKKATAEDLAAAAAAAPKPLPPFNPPSISRDKPESDYGDSSGSSSSSGSRSGWSSSSGASGFHKYGDEGTSRDKRHLRVRFGDEDEE